MTTDCCTLNIYNKWRPMIIVGEWRRMQPVIAWNIFTFPLELSGKIKFYLISPQNGRETSFLFSLSIGWEKLKLNLIYPPSRLVGKKYSSYTFAYMRTLIFIHKYDYLCLFTTNYDRKRSLSHIKGCCRTSIVHIVGFRIILFTSCERDFYQFFKQFPAFIVDLTYLINRT